MQTLTSGCAPGPPCGMRARYHCRVITLSIVSHGQAVLADELLRDLHRLGRTDLRILLTLNLPEAPPEAARAFGASLEVICNATRKGFGANHNQAFAAAH